MGKTLQNVLISSGSEPVQRAFQFVEGDMSEAWRKAQPSGWVGSSPYWNCAECGEPIFDFDNATTYVTRQTKEEVETGIIINEEIINKAKQSFRKVISEIPGAVDKFFAVVRSDVSLYHIGVGLRIDAGSSLVREELEWLNNIYKSFASTEQGKNIRDYFQQLSSLPYTEAIEKVIASNREWERLDSLTPEEKQKVIMSCKGVTKNAQILANQVISALEQLKGYRGGTPRTIIETLPICNKCFEEIGFECEEEGCDFSTMDEDEIVEVENKTWNPEKQKWEKEITHLCKEHGADCEICGEGLNKSADEVKEWGGDWYHDNCFFENYDYCVDCDDIISREEAYYDEDGEAHCQNCYEKLKDGIAGQISYTGAEKIVNNIMDERPNLYPLDEKTITGNILPILNLARKKFGDDLDDKLKNWIMKRIQKPDAKAAVGAELEITDNTKNIIDVFNGNIKYQQRIKQNYPKLKGYRPIPLEVVVEESTSHEGTVFALYPTSTTLDWAERVMPGAKEAYKKYMKSKGHHGGAFGYARMSEDDGNIIIDNLQTDLDAPAFTGIENYLERDVARSERIYTLERDVARSERIYTREAEVETGPIAFYEVNKKDQEKYIQERKKTLEYHQEKLKKYRELKPALAWWFGTIKKFWITYLLDIIKDFSDEYGARTYLTSFDMQNDKWNGIPDRNRDVYEKVPKMMGMNDTQIDTKPEDLRRDTYTMRRVAEDLFQLTCLFCQRAEDAHFTD